MSFNIYPLGVLTVQLILIQFSLLENVLNSSNFFKPHIVSKSEELIVDAGSNVLFVCKGNDPLEWKLPNEQPYEHEDFDLWKIRIKIYNYNIWERNETYKYGSQIVLQNVTYVHTGFLICYGNDSSDFEEGNVDKVYLYVRDKEHLSVFTENDIIYTNQKKNLLIPCRPTSPDVNVSLVPIMKEVKGHHKLSEKNEVDNSKSNYTSYNPRYGFTIKEFQGYSAVQCLFQRGLQTFNYTLSITVVPTFPLLLTKSSDEHTFVGDMLILTCEVFTEKQVFFRWSTPTGPPNTKRIKIRPFSSTSYQKRSLIIQKAAIEDEGLYSCKITTENPNIWNSKDLHIKIFKVFNESFINLFEENRAYRITVNANKKSVQWKVNVEAFPQPEIYWFNNFNKTISQNSTKYKTTFSKTQTVLEIFNITIADYGNYTVLARNNYGIAYLLLFLNVTDKPSVYLEFVSADKPTFQCKVTANPKPTISWSINSCTNDTCVYKPSNETYSTENTIEFMSYTGTEYSMGQVKCSAKNSIGSDEKAKKFYMRNVNEGLYIFRFDSHIDFNKEAKEVVTVADEKLNILCLSDLPKIISKYQTDFCEAMTLLHNETDSLPNIEYKLSEVEKMKYTCHRLLTIETLTLNDSGVYSCEYFLEDSIIPAYKNISLIVLEPSPPNITDSNLLNYIEVLLSDRVELYCKSAGAPQPFILWYKNDEPLKLSRRILMKNNYQTITFTSTKIHDEGLYKCVVTNKYGQASKTVNLRIRDNQKSFNLLILIPVVVLIILIFLVVIFFIFKFRSVYKLRRELNDSDLANWERGDLENFNPDLGIEEQADLLPYHYKWEFPIQELKLDKQLGSGAFGVVMKAEARRIVDGEDFTTVAVKMLKKNTDHNCIRALLSELKIMAYLGKHLNIVNLLGACTRNLYKRELFVIVEYCPFGNLRDYLLKHRKNFIDQIDPETGNFNNIEEDISEETYQRCSTSQLSDMKLPRMSHHKVDGQTIFNRKNCIPGKAQPLCTRDLLIWAFQVARGMDFLTSRHVLHGDLAARNILLTEGNIVKICDFGLSRRVYTNKIYKKKTDCPLPFKWMALESIRDGIFSVESDVWSFGIVLWEFFSLGELPYPGMRTDEKFYEKLAFGYRMDSPIHAPKEIYKIMLECWRGKPFVRPSFSKLADRIGSFLEDKVRQHLVDLNNPTRVMKIQNPEDNTTNVKPSTSENSSVLISKIKNSSFHGLQRIGLRNSNLASKSGRPIMFTVAGWDVSE